MQKREKQKDSGGGHLPVLLKEVVDGLDIKPGGIYLDATFGRGGHAASVLDNLDDSGRLFAVDKDPSAVAVAKQRFSHDPRFHIEQGSFAQLSEMGERWGVSGQFDGIMMDLGVSSPQLDEASRGFSFRLDGPLDMRMDPGSGISAADWLAEAEEVEIARVIFHYGEEKRSRKIASAICQHRQQQALTTTTELATLVAEVVPAQRMGKHPATKTFQAIRIFLNRELEDLRDALDKIIPMLAPGGRLAIISFHSLEDRIVKRFMRDHSRDPQVPRGLPLPPGTEKPPLRNIARKIRATAEELLVNPRARSAVLRISERAQ